MPVVTIRTGITDADCDEEAISEYRCDWPDCPNTAVHAVGVVRELNAALAVCSEHAAHLRAAPSDSARR